VGGFKEEDRLLGREAISKILQAGKERSASRRKRFASDPESEQRDAVYADLRHTKRSCNTVYSIGSDAHVTQQPAAPRSPAIDSVDSSRVAKSQALPPHHDLLRRQTYLSDASSDGWRSVPGAEEVDEQRRIPSLRAAALRILALCASAQYVSGLGLLPCCHLTMAMSATFTAKTC
jgi:hypothetical protein